MATGKAALPLLALSLAFMPVAYSLALAPRKTTLALSPLLVLFALSPFSPRARFYLRVAAFLGGLSVCSVWGVVSALAVAVVRPSWRRNIQWLVARSFYRLVGPVVGIEFVVEGEEYLEKANQGVPHVIIGNHQSMIDVLYIGRLFPKTCVVMAKKELKYAPLLGQFMTLSRAVFVDRQNRNSAVATFQKIAEEMKRIGLNLFIFAEGTRSGSSVPALLPFKKGAFHLAIEAQIPLIPVVCENYHSLYHSATKAHPSSVFERGRLVIKVLEPIPTTEFKDGANGGANGLADKARERMLAALIELSKRPNAASGGRTTEEEEEKVRKLVAEGKKGI